MSPLFKIATKQLIKHCYDISGGVRTFSLSREGERVKIRSYRGDHGTLPIDEYQELVSKMDRNMSDQSTASRHFALHFHLVAKGIIN